MGGLSLFSKKPKEEVSLVLDIGNGSIGGALVQFSRNHIPVVLYSHREPITFQQNIDSKKLVDLMVRLLTVVLQRIHNDGLVRLHAAGRGRSLTHVFCSFSTPWFTSQTKVVRLQKEKPFVVSSRLINDIIESEEAKFQEAVRNGQYVQIFGSDVAVIERNIIQARLNGYEVHSPQGKTAHTVELSLFTSLMSKSLLRTIEDTIRTNFYFKQLVPQSFSLVSFSTIRDLFPQESSFVMMDVTGEVTDISITKDGMITDTVSFPMGRSAILRKISDELNASPEIALSLIKTYLEGHADPSASEKVIRVLNDFEREWCGLLYKSLSMLSQDAGLPKKVFLTVDDDVAGFFIPSIQKQKCAMFPTEEGQQSGETFEVVFLNAAALAAHCEFSSRVRSDPFIALESIFMSKLMGLKT